MTLDQIPPSPITITDNDVRIETLLSRMTLAEKIGQMTQVENNSIQPKEVTQYAIGAMLSGGSGGANPNTPENWSAMVRGFQEAALQTRLRIPLLYGVDAVHGFGNMRGAVLFPHNIGLGATRNPELVEKIGRITALELLATGVHWAFAPALSVPQDIRWGRTYEGYSQNTEVVATLGTACLRGLQSRQGQYGWVLATPKHFVADGGTGWGSRKDLAAHTSDNWQAATPVWQIDQGNATIDEQALRTIHLAPYKAAIAEGALSIMVSFSSWNGNKLHGHRYLLTEVLKGELGFQGFLVSDWSAIDQLDGDYYTCVLQSINAGLDIIMVPYDYKRFIETCAKAIEQGDIPETRIDDAVRRILRAKFALGLFENPFGDPSMLTQVGSEEHREVAREAVRQSLVLLKNEGQVLPLKKDLPQLLVAGRGAHDIGLQCGGWSIEWQGKTGDITLGTTILQGIQHIVSENTQVIFDANGEFSPDMMAEVGIVVLAESPYAEGYGDRADLTLPAEDIDLLESVRKHCRKLVVILLSGRPLIVTAQLAMIDAFIAAWLPGTEGQGVADVLFGDYPFTGKLSYTFPRHHEQLPASALVSHSEPPLFQFGYGL